MLGLKIKSNFLVDHVIVEKEFYLRIRKRKIDLVFSWIIYIEILRIHQNPHIIVKRTVKLLIFSLLISHKPSRHSFRALYPAITLHNADAGGKRGIFGKFDDFSLWFHWTKSLNLQLKTKILMLSFMKLAKKIKNKIEDGWKE